MLICVMVLDEPSGAGSAWKTVFMHTSMWINPFSYGGFLTGYPGEPPAESSHTEELRRFPLLFQNMMHSVF